MKKLFICLIYISFPFLCSASAKTGEVKFNSLPDEEVYISEGGHDVLKIKNSSSAKIFDLLSTGGNGHICMFDGKISSLGEMTINGDSEDYPPNEQCVLNAKFNDQGVDLRHASESCERYCGARADFRSYYLRVSKKCTPDYIEMVINSYEKAPKIGKMAFVEKNIMPILRQCSTTLSITEKDKINLVIAMSHYSVGNKKACLKTLSLYDKSEFPGPGVTDIELMEELMKKVIYIRGLCKVS